MQSVAVGTVLVMRTRIRTQLQPALGWLVACAMVPLFVLMSVSGDDIFARHVGMAVSAHADAGATPEAARTALTSSRAETSGDAALGVVPRPEPDAHAGAAHTLHMLGACLAILCAGVVFLHRRGWWSGSTSATATMSVRLTFPASWLARVRRGPPPLDPPRFSPVIRT
jgi:hypothetical protein